MTPDELQIENAEAERAANLFCAGIKDCFWYATENPQEIAPEKVFQEIRFNVLTGPGATMLQNHTGLLTILVDAPAPLRAWFPERLSLSIHPEYASIWKTQVQAAIEEVHQDLRDEAAAQVAAEAPAEGEAEPAEPSEEEAEPAAPVVEVLPPEGA